MNKWVRFMDMRSGGGLKEPYAYIYIEALCEDDAITIFYNRFGHSPHRVTCTCCGEDYGVDDGDSLADISAYERGCDYAYFRPDGTECPKDEGWITGKGIAEGYSAKYVERKGKYRKHVTLGEYLKDSRVLVIRATDIQESERQGTVPDQGYIYHE